MARERIVIAGGFTSNVDPAFLPKGRASVALNMMMDDAGNSVGRPGLSSFVTPVASLLTVNGDNRIVAMCAFREFLVLVDGNRRLFSVARDASYRDITGVRLPGSATPTFLDLDGQRLIVCGGGSAIEWDGVGMTGPFAEGGSPDATHMVVAQKYILANNRGTDRVNFSRPESQLDWTGGEYFRAETNSDPILAMHQQWGRVFLFGSRSLDVYYNVGAAQGDFGREWSIPRGIAGSFAKVEANQALFFLGDDRKVYQLDNSSVPRVMSEPIGASLRSLTRPDDCVAHHIEAGGAHLVGWFFKTDKVAYLLDYVHSTPSEPQWFEWSEWSGGVRVPMHIEAYAHQPMWNRSFCAGGLENRNVVYELDTGAYTDDGDPIRRMRRFRIKDDEGTVTVWSVLFRVSCGTTAVTDSTAKGYEPELQMRVRKEGREWSATRRASLGKVGDTGIAVEYQRLGRSCDFELELLCDDPIPFTLGRYCEVSAEQLDD